MAEFCNESAVLHPEDKSFTLESVPVPVPKANEVLLAIQWTGICATDVHLRSWGKLAGLVVDRPCTLGHESSGQVVEVGSDVKHLKKGDRVAVEVSGACLSCYLCLDGRYNMCPESKLVGLPPIDGMFTRYFAYDANFCHKLPDNVSNEEGAMVEPLSVALHACRRANIAAGDTVLISGAGPIGLLVLLVAKAMGAGKVLVTDIRGDRLETARERGASHTVIVGKKDEKSTAQQIREVLGEAPQASFDCCGFETSLKTCIYATKSGGVVIAVGVGPEETVNLPIVEAALREVDIRGVCRYANCYKRAIEMISSRAVNVKPLIAHKFPLKKILTAFKLAEAGKGIKVMVQCHKADST